MERFIRRQNVEHYRHLLETVTDENERERILRLLEEEKAESSKRRAIRQTGPPIRYCLPMPLGCSGSQYLQPHSTAALRSANARPATKAMLNRP